MNPFSLVGKTILITGASSGIGRATAISCSQMGAVIILTGRNETRLSATYSMLEGQDHLQICADLTIQNEMDKLIEQLPKLDGIVSVAGTAKPLVLQQSDK